MTIADSAAKKVLQQALIDSLNQHAAQLHGRRIWLACSGGRDSLSLAVLCRQLFDRGSLPFLPQLVHVNHGMQAENARWAQQVKDWSNQHDMPCTLLTLGLSHLNHISEQSARNARYMAMMRLMNNEDVLMLGHHQDDQIETLLMRLFKGAGVNGLAGMRDWTTFERCPQTSKPDNQSEFQQDIYNASQQNTSQNNQSNNNDAAGHKLPSHLNPNKSISLWRPWLGVSRATITEYAKHAKLEYIDDPTNVVMPLAAPSTHNNELTGQDVSILQGAEKGDIKTNDRAWLRSKLMPIIKQRYPQVNEAIARTSQIMQATRTLIDEQVQTDLATVSIHSASLQNISAMHSVLDISQLQTLLPARQATLIHAWLSPQPTELPPAKTMVNSVLTLSQRADNDHQTILYYSSGAYQYEIRRYQHKLYRLRSDWQQWLSIAPSKQHVNINNIRSFQDLDKDIEKTSDDNYQKEDQLSLKPRYLPFLWHIRSICSLIETLKTAGHNCVIAPDSRLYFEPLPRDLKVTLAGRVGRKSGKKLLQALNQPVFMRQSLVLCSLIQAIPQADSHATPHDPLFIIAIDKIYWLQNTFSERLNPFIDIKGQPIPITTQIIYQTSYS